MKEIMIWSDYACPFCYIGEKRLKDALNDLGLRKEFTIKYRAFELNPHAPRKTDENITDLMAKKYNLSHEEAKRRVEEIDKAGNDAGLVFRYSTAPSSNTLDAHRLMKFAEDKYDEKTVEDLNEGLFEAYFTDNRRLSDHDVLMQVAINAGLPTEETSRVLNSKHYTEQVRHDENEAHKLGVQGVPFIVFEGRLAVPGAIPTDEFKHILKELMAGKQAEDIAGGPECEETRK